MADEQISSKNGSTHETGLELDHLGLIVPDLEAGRRFLQNALGVSRWTPVIDDPALGVTVQFGTVQQGSVQQGSVQRSVPQSPAQGGGLVYELIAPLGEGSPVANALRAGKHILNHLAYLTADLRQSGEKLRHAGCYPAGDPHPAMAYGGSRVQFWMSPLRFVIELIEKPGHRHEFLETGRPS